MSDTKEKLGEFGCLILSELEIKAKAMLLEMVEPVAILREFQDVEVLTLDEAAKVLRREKQNLRDACVRGEVPHQAIGRDLIFPKRMLIAFLLGEWHKPDKKKPKIKLSSFDAKIRAFATGSQE